MVIQNYTASQWIEAEAVKIGKHIHHKMCEHGVERMVKDCVLDDKGRKTPVTFLADGYESETNTWSNTPKESYKKTTKEV